MSEWLVYLIHMVQECICMMVSYCNLITTIDSLEHLQLILMYVYLYTRVQCRCVVVPSIGCIIVSIPPIITR